jgi:hypothetical protein
MENNNFVLDTIELQSDKIDTNLYKFILPKYGFFIIQ